jgi:hypothetical protein
MITQKTLDKYKGVMDSLSKMNRREVYFGKKKLGYVIGVELNNIYTDEITVSVESLDHQFVNNYLLKDVNFKK